MEIFRNKPVLVKEPLLRSPASSLGAVTGPFVPQAVTSAREAASGPGVTLLPVVPGKHAQYSFDIGLPTPFR